MTDILHNRHEILQFQIMSQRVKQNYRKYASLKNFKYRLKMHY